MSKPLKRIVQKEYMGERLDIFLGSLSATPSRSACVRLIQNGDVLVNEAKITNKSHLLNTGDVIEIYLDELQDEDVQVLPDLIPLDIRYEDDYLIVLSKQPNMVCHPAHGHTRGTLANALVAYCGIHNLSTIQGKERPGIIHRLDADTSGLIICAKEDSAAVQLQNALKNRVIDRRYITLVHGLIAPDSGIIDAPITRSKKDRTKMTVSDDPSAKQAVTTFNVLERFYEHGDTGDYTLLECTLHTGRTHQIRVHMDYISHPCVGDQQYNSLNGVNELGLDRQFLHSWMINFTHPKTNENIIIYDYLHEDLNRAFNIISEYSLGRTKEGDRVLNLMTEAYETYAK